MHEGITSMSDKHIFTTAAGVEIPLNPIPPLQGQMVEQAARKKASELYGAHTKPLYTLTTDDGGEETHEHDETTIETDPAAKLAWKQWQECTAKTSAYVNDRLFDFAMLTGTDALLPQDESWIEMQTYLGIEVPEQSTARRAHYIKTELLRTTGDLIGIQNAITAISGINQEMLAAARATFSGDAQERGTAGDVDGAPGQEESQLVNQPTLLGTTDSEGLGADA